MHKFGKVLLALAWYATVAAWPFIKWILSLDVVLQGMRMIYRWNTPGAYPLLIFLAHFSLLVALTWFVSYYRPGSR